MSIEERLKRIEELLAPQYRPWHDHIGELFDLADEARLRLHDYFPDPRFTRITIIRDPGEPAADHLGFDIICESENYEQSMKAFEEFRNEWWFDKCSEAGGFLSIGLEWN